MLLSLTIEAHSPLAFAMRKPGTQFRESLPYIPGATIFGALGRWLSDQKRFDAELLEGLRCHNAYPAAADDSWVRPLPATVVLPKRGTGKPPYDTLIPRVCWEKQQPAALLYSEPDEAGRLLEDSRWPFYTLRDNQIVARDVTQRVLTRVAINRRRGTAEDQRLYSPLVLSEVTAGLRTQFRGSLVLPDGDETLSEALSTITHLGGRQSSGLGAVAIHSNEIQPESLADVRGRIEQLTKRFQQQAALYQSLRGKEWPIAPGTIFTINLLSDALLLERDWTPTTTLSAQILEDLTGIKATLLRAFTGSMIAGGWHVTWQRPKPTALATVIGSVFVFQASAPLTDIECAALVTLQSAGLGERRQEGYGQVRICDDFHLTRENDA